MKSTQARRPMVQDFSSAKGKGSVHSFNPVNQVRPVHPVAPVVVKVDPLDQFTKFKREREVTQQQARTISNKKSIVLRMVVDVVFDFDPKNATRFELEEKMNAVIKNGMDQGMFTGSLDASVSKWFTRVESL